MSSTPSDIADPTPLLAVCMITPQRVAQVMTREVVSLSPQQSVLDALMLLARHRFRHLLVVDADNHLVGVLSDRDLLRFLTREPQRETAAVTAVLKPHQMTVRPDTFLSTAAEAMLTRHVNCLPVTDEEGRVRGILTSTDLLRAFQQVQEWIEKQCG